MTTSAKVYPSNHEEYGRGCPTREEFEDRLVDLELALALALRIIEGREPMRRAERVRKVLDAKL